MRRLQPRPQPPLACCDCMLPLQLQLQLLQVADPHAKWLVAATAPLLRFVSLRHFVIKQLNFLNVQQEQNKHKKIMQKLLQQCKEASKIFTKLIYNQCGQGKRASHFPLSSLPPLFCSYPLPGNGKLQQNCVCMLDLLVYDNLQIGSAPRPYSEPDLNGKAMNANWLDG